MLPGDESNSVATSSELNGTPTWLTQAADAYALAKQALAVGQEEKAFASCAPRSRGSVPGAGRFRRTMQLIELAVAAGKMQSPNRYWTM